VLLYRSGVDVDVDVDDFPPGAAHNLKDQNSIDGVSSVYC